MTANGGRLMNERLMVIPRPGIQRDEEVAEEEEAAAGGVAGLVDRCEELSLVGGVDRGGFKLPVLEGGGGRRGSADRLAGGLGGAAGMSAAGQGESGGSVLVQGYGLVRLEVVVVRGGGDMVRVVGAANSGVVLFPRLTADGVGGSNWGWWWIWGGGAVRVILVVCGGGIWDVGWKKRVADLMDTSTSGEIKGANPFLPAED